MDIAKFNEQLRNKIIKAQRLEHQEYFKAAKDAWLDVSEFTLNASKDPKIDTSFRNMLINKTEKIIQHVKDLQRSKLEKTREELRSPTRLTKGSINTSDVEDNPSEVSDLNLDKKKEKIETTDDSQSKKIDLDDLPSVPNGIKLKKESEFKNLPKGFKEIEASEDFKVITPFDVKFIEDRIKESKEYDQKMKESKNNTKNNRIMLDKETKDGNIICFACGYENPPNSKICKSCGTPLE